MSAILSADDLNDFIQPGLACIKPVETVNKNNENNSNSIQVEIDENGNTIEIFNNGEAKKLDPAQISLTDCLACSGCVTSAESVLISLQSHTEVLNVLQEKKGEKTFIVSISHQSRVSLAATFNLSIENVDRKLSYFFNKILGFSFMVSTEAGRLISLLGIQDEILKKQFRNTIEKENNDNVSKIATVAETKEKSPILSSACPGWVCYVEKTHPFLIPYLSNVKSPQQITGTLIKEFVSKSNSIDKTKLYHLSIMPCFDKKLEASRADFSNDVDCVITSRELIKLFEEFSVDFQSLDQFTDESLRQLVPKNWPIDSQLWGTSNPGSSSGGYLYYALSTYKQYFKNLGILTSVVITQGRNSDITEYKLLNSSTNEELVNLAQIYGFKNIQNLVRKLKPSNSSKFKSKRRQKNEITNRGSLWDYVEVMACPGGCINGGGQIGAPSNMSTNEWKSHCEEIYQNIKKIDDNIEQIRKWLRIYGNDNLIENYNSKNESENQGKELLSLNEKLIHMSFNEVTYDPSTEKAAITVATKW